MIKKIVLAILMVLFFSGFGHVNSNQECTACHSIHPLINSVNLLGTIDQTLVVTPDMLMADLRSDFRKIEEYGEPLVRLEAERDAIIVRMTKLRVRLNNLKGKATGLFGAGSPEETEIANVAIKTRSDLIAAANAF